MALQIQGFAARLRAAAGVLFDGTLTQVATDSYGRLIVDSLTASDHVAADEGSYFVTSGGVAGTTFAIPVGPATSVPPDLNPFILISNTATPGPKSPNIWLKRILAILSGAQTSETSLVMQGQLDNGLLYTSGGTKLAVANQNPLGPASVAAAYAGSLVKVAKTAAVIYCARSTPRLTIPIVGDTFLWKFGGSDSPAAFSVPTTICQFILETGPIVIPPGWTFSLHAAFGATSTGAPAIEVEIGHIER